MARRSEGKLLFNHLEAVDHCRTTRAELQARMAAEGLAERVYVPDDGEALRFERRRREAHVRPQPARTPKPGIQKWLTAKLAGT